VLEVGIGKWRSGASAFSTSAISTPPRAAYAASLALHCKCENARKIRNANAVDAGALMSRPSVCCRCLPFDDAHAQRWPSAKTCGHGKRRLRGIDISPPEKALRLAARARMRSK